MNKVWQTFGLLKYAKQYVPFDMKIIMKLNNDCNKDEKCYEAIRQFVYIFNQPIIY